MRAIEVRANIGKEVAEISRDFTHPIEVVREALHNAYDAGAKTVEISALVQTLPDGRRVLTLEVFDDGIGMTEDTLAAFFGLGLSEKPGVADRRIIGFKGHGTKIYFQAQELAVATRCQNMPLLCAAVNQARESVYSRVAPRPQLYEGNEASSLASTRSLRLPNAHGTSLRLIDFTPESGRLIEDFKTFPLENYIFRRFFP
ncbi:MAG: ATP-binding protein [Gemmataceae bacterium]